MALTEHELKHLNDAIAEAQKKARYSNQKKRKLATRREVKAAAYNKYLDRIIADAENIKSSGKFPDGLRPADIHAYLEQPTEAERNG